MAIRRQYSLPNCTLILEGFSNDIEADFTLGTGTLHTLTNAECHLAGRSQPLSGGQTFLEQLVTSVSAYAQECLSGLRAPTESAVQKDHVELESIPETQRHRLVWHSTTESQTDPVTLELTSVQLFDLVEVVDQFFADTTTLPELTLTLQPISRRYRREEEPLVQRAMPAVLGVASLAIAGFTFFMMPIPKVEEPASDLPQTTDEPVPTQPNPVDPINPATEEPVESTATTETEKSEDEASEE